MWKLPSLYLYTKNHGQKRHYKLQYSTTAGVVYVMKCVCGKTYVGKTQREFRRRILERVEDVKNKRNTTVAIHIN